MQKSSASIRRLARRSAAAAVESAVVLSILLLILFCLFDLGLAVLNSNNLADAAQQLTRRAIVRGQSAAPNYAVWGPATYNGTAASGDEIAGHVAANILVMPCDQVQIKIEWLDGGCDEGDRVRAKITYLQPFMTPALLGIPSRQLTAVSTARIVQ
jgi:hypothetical protein